MLVVVFWKGFRTSGRVLVPFAVDPPEWYVFNSRFGGRGARSGPGTPFGLAVVPRVYRVFAGLLIP